jgi:hypothetical protein
VDVAAVWGPTADYFSSEMSPPLVVTQFDVAFDSGLAFVRKTDVELGDAVQEALDELAPEIHATLESYGAPLIERDLRN